MNLTVRYSKVLILVLMEDALRDTGEWLFVLHNKVLILVLMEDALRGEESSMKCHLVNCLNPCSNGRCSASSHGGC